MNNTEKFTKLRKLFEKYESIKAEKNRRIYEIQNLLIPGGIKENFIKEYKAFVDPKIEKIANEIMTIVNDKTITCVLDREDAIRYGSEKNVNLKIYGSIFKVSEIQEAKRVCTSGPCGHESCPLAGQRGCVHIWEAYDKGDYKEV